MTRTNFDRAEAAKAALRAYVETNSGRYAEEPLEDQVGDLLCDLLHLVRGDNAEAESPVFLLDRARSNFEEESETCSECGAPLDDGDGFDGKCGNCADVDDAEDVEDNLRRAELGGARDPRNDRKG